MSADDAKPGAQPDDRDAEPTLDEGSRDAADRSTRRIGHFEILQVLGQGAFGAVYRARDPVLEREVAIKVPHASRIATSEMRERFLREARAAAGLRHPHICPVFEIGEEHDTPYIVMAFIKGQELSSVLQKRGHLTDRQAAVMVRRLALALEFAHQQGIVHRDLKPDNIMIDRERKEPVIMDFGLARRDSSDESRMTQEGQLMGTPVYMPPEQARGDVKQIGPASDIYSLGVILYELLCGRRPHEGSLAEVLSKVLTTDAAPPSTVREDISPELERICLKAIARESDQRFASMADFARELGVFLKSEASDSGNTPAASSKPTNGAASDGAERHPALDATVLVTTPQSATARRVWTTHRTAVVAGLVGLITTIIGIVFLADGDDRPEPVSEEVRQATKDDSESILVREFQGISERLSDVQFSLDANWIAAKAGPRTVLIWSRGNTNSRAQIRHSEEAPIESLQFSNDSQRLTVLSRNRLLNVSLSDKAVNVIVELEPPFQRSLVCDRDGRFFVCNVASPSRTFGLVEYDSDGTRVFPGVSIPFQSRFADVRLILPGTKVFLGLQRETGEFLIWDYQGRNPSGQQGNVILVESRDLTVPDTHNSPPTVLVSSRDERIAASAAADGSVILWDIRERRLLKKLKRHPSTVHSLALSPDNRFLLTGCGTVSHSATADTKGLESDHSIRLWNVETGELVAIVGSHRDTVTGLAFGSSPDEAVSCSADNTVCLWKLPAAQSVTAPTK